MTNPDERPAAEQFGTGDKAFAVATLLAIGVVCVLFALSYRLKKEDDFDLPRILATLPGLISHKFEGALFPIELANGIASMSSYPSAKILQRFIEDPKRA